VPRRAEAERFVMPSEPEFVWPFDYAVQRAQSRRTGEWEILA